ncbi:hypothetical protein CEUSTIGMA_g5396.t1 [Chlamydomonas eustigma]|uniref:Histone-binding protein RBBP4-like N-terminal domain-containing protein n=1 Tax=Chlamydomonas eustigma TaxID=1157962 RepID=A0A250X4E5_9CHLO|nr:hypothetical protein CEUSTIGMA_g5396.t1 [Chlamydomonas eustigma]|eukprot:GAX77954.1 hypothetical protein CEUSTIGMA_g5396.t1 [Chlamydomonas eustigma]
MPHVFIDFLFSKSMDFESGGRKQEVPTAVRIKTFFSSIPLWCDAFVTHDLETGWQSPSVDWLNGFSADHPDLPGWCCHTLAMGTLTNEEENNQLLIYKVMLPKSHAGRMIRVEDQESASTEDICDPPDDYQAFELLAAVPHEGNVDRIRSMPQTGHLLATKSEGAAIHVFEVSSLLSQSSQDRCVVDEGDEDCGQQQLRHVCSTSTDSSGAASGPAPQEAGMCWSAEHKGLLLSTCQNGLLALYDLGSSSGSVLNVNSIFDGHGGQTVNDVAFAGSWSPHLFGSVGDDGCVCIWDLRLGRTLPGSGSSSSTGCTDRRTNYVQRWQAHGTGGRGEMHKEVNGIAFSQLRPNSVATGGNDGMIKLWDLRKQPSSVSVILVGSTGGTSVAGGTPVEASCLPEKVLPSHRSPVFQLSWCPHHASVLASCDIRGLVYVWDVSCDREGETEDLRSNAKADTRHKSDIEKRVDPIPKRPELRMIQAGHACQVTDLSWCPDGSRGRMLLATVSAAYSAEEEAEEQDTYVDLTRSAAREGLVLNGVQHPGPKAEMEQEQTLIQDHNVQIWRPSEDLFYSEISAPDILI